MTDPKEKQLRRFKKLDEEWRSDMLSRKDSKDLDQKIYESAANLIRNKMEKELDPDIADLTEKLSAARERYKESEKINLLRIEFLFEAKRTRGEDVPSLADIMDEVQKKDDKRIEKEEAELRGADGGGAAPGFVDGDGNYHPAPGHDVVLPGLVAEHLKGVAKSLKKGESMTISSPSGKSATIKGES
jgi:hypothetical protein